MSEQSVLTEDLGGVLSVEAEGAVRIVTINRPMVSDEHRRRLLALHRPAP